MFFIRSFSDRVLEIINQNFELALKETSQKLEKSISDIKSRRGTTTTSYSGFKLGVQTSDMSVFSRPGEGDSQQAAGTGGADGQGAQVVAQKRWLFADVSASDLGSKNFDIVMKSLGFTPEVQILCKHVNRTVQKTLTDVFYCIEQLDAQPGNGLETIRQRARK